MKLHKVLLFGFLLIQPGWLLANTSWAELSPRQQYALAHYAPYWHTLDSIQKKTLLHRVASIRHGNVAAHSIKRNRHGHWKGHSKRHPRKSLRNGLHGNISLHFGSRHRAHKQHKNYRYHSPKQRYNHGKRWGRYSRKYHH